MEYQDLRIKKSKSGASVKNIASDFGIYCKSVPFKMFGDAKEMPSNDWIDENGKDVYIPDTIKVSSYDLKIDFVYKGSLANASSTMTTFFRYLTGHDGSGAEMSIYDKYYKIGRQKIYYKSMSDDADVIEYIENGVDSVLISFDVTFEVCDPVTDITL